MVGRSRPDLLGIRSTNSLICFENAERGQPAVASLEAINDSLVQITAGRPGREGVGFLLRKWQRAARNCNSRNSPATHIDMGVWGPRYQ